MKKKKNKNMTLEDAIIELYLNVKIRKQEEIEKYDSDSQEKEKEKLRKANPFTIIEYIKSSIEILIDLKVQEKLQEKDMKKEEPVDKSFIDEEVSDYEKLLRKLEADIRSYIKIEHQLKLHSENLQQKVEELERSKEELKTKNKSLQETISRLRANSSSQSNDEEITQYKNEISQLQQLVKTYEEHNLKIPELEKKLRSQKTKYEKEIKDIETFYKEKIKSFNKKLSQYEEKIKFSTNNTSKLDKTIEDIDRVNYNYVSSRNAETSSTNNRSRTHSPDAAHSKSTRISKTITDRKKEIDYISNKIDQFKKGIDRKISDNIKNIIDDLKGKKETSSNKTAIENDRTMNLSKIKTNSDVSDIINFPKTHRKHESSGNALRNIDGIKTMISNYHSRGSSHDRSKIPQNYNTSAGGKTIHAMKDIIKIPKDNINNVQTHTPNNYKNNNSLANNSNIILNQNGVPCYNNIHIYTSGISGIKSGDINLRHYIFNKAGKKTGLKLQNKSSLHARSSSAAGSQ